MEEVDSAPDRVVGGIRHSWATTDEMIEGIKTMEVRPDDIWVITFPKAGTIWMQEIVSVLFYGCDFEKADAVHIRDRFNFLDLKDPEEVNPHTVAAEKPSPRLMKTHFPNHQMPTQINTKKPKVVYVGRNPKDNAVSLYNFHQTIPLLKTYGSWDEYYEALCIGDVHGGSWFDTNLYWWNKRNDDNVLFVKYEDMQKDLKSVVVKVSEFFGWSIPDGRLEDIIHHCTFSSMKQNPQTNSGAGHDFLKNAFMRKGEVGDWKNYFTVSQSDEFDKLYVEKMKDSGLTFQYELVH